MRSLLDTQLLLWAMLRPHRLPSEARELIANTYNDLFFSAVSIWEVAIKTSSGKPAFQIDPVSLRRGLLNNGYTEIPVTSQHGIGVRHLPWIHKDPFDRLLISQASAEEMWLFTTDKLIAQYPGPIRRVG